MAFCYMCGKSISDTAAFCPYCGTKTEGAIVQPTTVAVPVPEVHITPAEPEPVTAAPVLDYDRYPHLNRSQEPESPTPAETAPAEPVPSAPVSEPAAPVESAPPVYTRSSGYAAEDTGSGSFGQGAPVGYTPYPPTGEYTSGSFSAGPRPVDNYAPTTAYDSGAYTGYQPEVVKEEPPKKREMPWQSDPRAREAAEKASRAATQTVSGMMDAYKKALSIVFTKPIMLWGLSLLYNLLTTLAVLFSLLPIIWLPINLVLQLGMSSIFLSGIRGKRVNSDALFAGFQDFFKNAGGMGWKALWMIIWGIVVGVLAGVASAAFTHGSYIMEMGKYMDFGVLKQIVAVIEIVLAVAALIVALVVFVGKRYAYDFVPYILLSEEGISATEALRRSIKLSRGWKLKMFAADAAVILGYAILVAVFAGLTSLTDGFFLFKILLVLIGAIGSLLGPMFFGLLHAAFYEMAAGRETK